MSTKSHDASWLRPAKGTTAPAAVLSIVLETQDVTEVYSTGHHVAGFKSAHVAYSKKRRGTWSDPLYRHFDRQEDVWDFLEEQTREGRRLHVFTDNAMQTLLLLGMTDRFEEHGVKWDDAAARAELRDFHGKEPPATSKRGRPRSAARVETAAARYRVSAMIEGTSSTIIRYRAAGRSFLWTNFRQYLAADEESIATVIGYRWPNSAEVAGSTPGVVREPAERCLLWCRMFCRLANWWQMNDGGPWGASAASCAKSFLRVRVKAKSILQHNHADAAALEDKSIFAGRRQVWFFGNIGSEADWRPFAGGSPPRSSWPTLAGGMVHFDIRSMYPYLLSRCDYPVRLLEVRRDPSPAAVAANLERFGVIAAVTLETREPLFPQRTPKGIRYPIGRFMTHLAGPELALACSAGSVKEVHAAAFYALGNPFVSTAEQLLQLRKRYREDGEPAWELFAKSLANSLSGKLAQRAFEWRPRPKVVAPTDWGYWSRVQHETGDVEEYNTRAGLTWQKVESETRRRPMGATYAYLTSYGRVLMNWVRSLCPENSVLMQDTDGIWVTPAAAEVLNGFIGADSSHAGDLTPICATPAGRFFGPQHYFYGSAWVLSGYGSITMRPCGTLAEVIETGHQFWRSKGRPSALIEVRAVERDVGRIQVAGSIGEDGWLCAPWTWNGSEEADHQRKPDTRSWQS